jgi:hypothetical protein
MAEKITGYTSEMCQQAMIDELKELFRDMKFTGQEGEKPLKIFKQFIPSPTDDDDDVDFPYRRGQRPGSCECKAHH